MSSQYDVTACATDCNRSRGCPCAVPELLGYFIVHNKLPQEKLDTGREQGASPPVGFASFGAAINRSADVLMGTKTYRSERKPTLSIFIVPHAERPTIHF